MTAPDVLDPAVAASVRAAAARACRRADCAGVDTDDLEQAAWLGVVRAATRFRPGAGSGWRSWASYAATHGILDHLRDVDPLKRKQRRSVQAGSAAPATVALTDAALAVDDGPVDFDWFDAYRPLLWHLGDRTLSAADMVWGRGWTQTEAARRLGVVKSLVSMMLSEALAALRTHFGVVAPAGKVAC